MSIAKRTHASTFYSPRLFLFSFTSLLRVALILGVVLFCFWGVLGVQWDGLGDVTDAELQT